LRIHASRKIRKRFDRGKGIRYDLGSGEKMRKERKKKRKGIDK